MRAGGALDYTVMPESDSDRAARPRTWIWWALAALALAAGYADLIRGGMTIAPLLLVLGYVVLIPIAILR